MSGPRTQKQTRTQIGIGISVGTLAAMAAIGTPACGATDANAGQNGGNATSDGTGGAAGGSGTQVGQVGTLGESCGQPGKLACAGNYQKLGLVCGADRKWATNQTCSGDQICDTQGTLTAGTCVSPDPACAVAGPGRQICLDNEVYQCGPDAITKDLVSTCPGGCKDAVCQDPDPCPAAVGDIVCSSDCGGPSTICATCSGSVVQVDFPWSLGNTKVVRVPATTDAGACQCSQGSRRTFEWTVLASYTFSGDALRVTVNEPWWIGEPYIRDTSPYAPPYGPPKPDICLETQAPRCLVVSDRANSDSFELYLQIATDSSFAPARNVTLERVAAGTSCP